MDDISFRIEIPSDEDGFVLFRCPHCGELFKVSVEGVEDDSVLAVHCPACGLTADNFLTEDVVELALAIAKNRAVAAIAKELEKQTKKHKSGFVDFKVNTKGGEEPEIPLSASVEALELATCHDCGRSSKIQPSLSMSIYTCPYCGIGQANER